MSLATSSSQTHLFQEAFSGQKDSRRAALFAGPPLLSGGRCASQALLQGVHQIDHGRSGLLLRGLERASLEFRLDELLDTLAIWVVVRAEVKVLAAPGFDER